MSDFQSIGPRQYRLSDLNASGKPISAEPTLLGMTTRVKERSEYGERLFAARRHAKLTQKQLADKAEMSQSNLAELERSGQGSAKTARIAQVTGVRAAWLADGDGPMLDDSDVPAAAHQVASEKVAHYLLGKTEPRDYRTITLTLAAALEESGTTVTVQQFVKLVEATHRKFTP